SGGGGRPPACPRRYLELEARAAKPWRDVAGVSTYSLRLTAEELGALHAALDAAIRPYTGLTRAAPPEGAQPVHLDLKACLLPEVLTGGPAGPCGAAVTSACCG